MNENAPLELSLRLAPVATPSFGQAFTVAIFLLGLCGALHFHFRRNSHKSAGPQPAR